MADETVVGVVLRRRAIRPDVVGTRIVRDSVSGLMDAALPVAEQDVLRRLLDGYASEGVQYHALRTRQAGARRFVSVHVLVPPEWTVQQGHDTLERIEAEIARALPPATVFTHLEPIGDPAAMNDLDLHREHS